MVDVVPFPCVRPNKDMVQKIAALPYDVLSKAEAQAEIAKHPHSFLSIDMPEATFDTDIDHNDDAVFERARDLLNAAIERGDFIIDSEAHYYLYQLTTPDNKSQTGVVGCSSIKDYENKLIKKHEKTRADKEYNRIHHVDTTSAQTGPIFLAFRSDGALEKIMDAYSTHEPLYNFLADDGVRHCVWRVDEAQDCELIKKIFDNTEALYIADGHHRAASAVKAGLMRRKAAGNPSTPLESDHFLSVIFPSEQLQILDYNRVVADLNGYSAHTFKEAVATRFEISAPQKEAYRPQRKGSFGMYLDGLWYGLTIKEQYLSTDPVEGLDVALLQNNLLEPFLGIKDPRTDKRIDFVGGIRGLTELERRTSQGMAVAFALFPTSIEELFNVADAGLLMPPKSTWFEPKLRSGIFIHQI